MTGGAAGRRGALHTGAAAATDPYDDDAACDIDYGPPHTIPVDDVETWGDYWSEDLAIVYHVLKDQVDSMGLPMLERCTFNDFVDFVYAMSSKLPPKC